MQFSFDKIKVTLFRPVIITIFILVIYFLLKYFFDSLEFTLNIVVYILFIILYAFEIFNWLTTFEPPYIKNSLTTLKGKVNSLEIDSHKYNTYRSRSNTYNYKFKLEHNSKPCVLNCKTKLAIKNGHNVKVAGLYEEIISEDNEVFSIYAIMNYDTRKLRTDNFFVGLLLMFLLLTLVLALSVMLVNSGDNNLYLKYFGAFMINLISIPIIMFIFRSLNHRIRAMNMVTLTS